MHQTSQPLQHTVFVVALACLVLTLLQTAHFYFYFEQPLWISSKWSIKGAIIWFGIFIGVIALDHKDLLSTPSPTSELVLWAMLAITCGALQIFTAVFMDFILGTAARPLIDDFLHLYSKRLIQNTLIAGLFITWWRLYSNHKTPEHTDSSAPLFLSNSKHLPDQTAASNEPRVNKLKIVDGAVTHWVEVCDISHIESLGNYVCIHTNECRLVERKTLTSIATELLASGFLKISRSAIVNVAHVKSSHRRNRNRLEIETTSGEFLSVGRTYQPAVKLTLKL